MLLWVSCVGFAVDLEFWIQEEGLWALGVRHVFCMCLFVIYERDFQLVGPTLIAYFSWSILFLW